MAPPIVLGPAGGRLAGRPAQRDMLSMFSRITLEASTSAPLVSAFHFKNPTSSRRGAEQSA
jgi:hypothetical protein